MARGMRLMLDDPDLRAVPRNPRGLGGQCGDETEEVERHLVGDVRRYPLLMRAFQFGSDSRAWIVAPHRAVP